MTDLQNTLAHTLKPDLLPAAASQADDLLSAVQSLWTPCVVFLPTSIEALSQALLINIGWGTESDGA